MNFHESPKAAKPGGRVTEVKIFISGKLPSGGMFTIKRDEDNDNRLVGSLCRESGYRDALLFAQMLRELGVFLVTFSAYDDPSLESEEEEEEVVYNSSFNLEERP